MPTGELSGRFADVVPSSADAVRHDIDRVPQGEPFREEPRTTLQGTGAVSSSTREEQ